MSAAAINPSHDVCSTNQWGVCYSSRPATQLNLKQHSSAQRDFRSLCAKPNKVKQAQETAGPLTKCFVECRVGLRAISLVSRSCLIMQNEGLDASKLLCESEHNLS
jgi:hypothetical protein